MTAPVIVELDIFSGMPNPTWTLSDEQATEILDRVAALSTDHAAAPLPGHLGYRGVTAMLVWRDQPVLLRVYNGLGWLSARDDVHFFGDPGRDLERSLLRTGEALVAPDILDVVTREIGL